MARWVFLPTKNGLAIHPKNSECRNKTGNGNNIHGDVYKKERRKHTTNNDQDVDQENWTDWGPLLLLHEHMLWHKDLIHVIKSHTIVLFGLYRINNKLSEREQCSQCSTASSEDSICFRCRFCLRVSHTSCILHMHFTRLQNRQAFFLPSVPKHLCGHFPKPSELFHFHRHAIHVLAYCVPRAQRTCWFPEMGVLPNHSF